MPQGGYADAFFQGLTDAQTRARQARLDAIAEQQTQAEFGLKQAVERRNQTSADALADYRRGRVEDEREKIRQAARQRVVDEALGPTKEILKDPEVSSQVAGEVAPAYEAASKLPDAKPDPGLTEGRFGPPGPNTPEALRATISQHVGNAQTFARDFHDRKLRAQQLRAEKMFMPSDHQVDEITSTQDAVDAFQKTLAQLPNQKDNLGPRAAMRNSMAQSFGVADPKFTAFRGQVTDQLAGYLRNISGKVISDNERAFLLGALPLITDMPDVFEEKTKMVLNRLHGHMQRYLGGMRAQGKNVSRFAGAPPAAVGGGSASADDIISSHPDWGPDQVKAELLRLRGSR